ncbi:iron ABC transporter permease [Bradyrhizobium sp. ARR65]|uniref:FecCD family ABC transporter permease n=1 Tax=Bradyrhizobium sp. ARR65 TaxID=1040989 RepID=UPI00046689EC|nr:iron ABC transporter permease [Bradyrhizobium sp. ARR65]
MTAIEADVASLARLVSRYRRRVALATGLGVCLCTALALIALGEGAVSIPPQQVAAILWEFVLGWTSSPQDRETLVVTGIRLPRVLLGLEIGAALAVSGALMQGLFRNPLADPGLIGVSSGAAFAAAVTLVLGDRFLGDTVGKLPFAILPASAFCGGVAATLVIYTIATRQGRTSMATMLLAGLALGALAGAATGLLSYVSDDKQLRDLTFWSLGNLNGGTWSKLGAVSFITLPLLCAAPFLGRGLNALSFGEAEAFHLGFRVEWIKAATIFLVALAVGASVASAGLIGFIGIVAPHIVRLAVGADHRVLLPLSALFGAALLVGADTLARTLLAPAELPVGILTALLGAPFFLWLLLRRANGSFVA